MSNIAVPTSLAQTALGLAFQRAFSIESVTPTTKQQPQGSPKGKRPAKPTVVGGRTSGTVSVFSHVNGYGNIVGEDGQSYFVHQMSIESQFTNVGFRALQPGMEVTFESYKGAKGLEARKVVHNYGSYTLPKRVRQGEGQNFWHAEGGVLYVHIEGRNGLVKDGVEPALLMEAEQVAYFYTDTGINKLSHLSFRLPATKMVAAVALDPKKQLVAADEVPFGGFIVIAKKAVRGMVTYTIRRFGKRFDKQNLHGSDVYTNMVIVEQRLKGTVPQGASIEEIEACIRKEHEGSFLLDYDAEFAPAIKAAMDRIV